jgi:hypothetical protein
MMVNKADQSLKVDYLAAVRSYQFNSGLLKGAHQNDVH